MGVGEAHGPWHSTSPPSSRQESQEERIRREIGELEEENRSLQEQLRLEAYRRQTETAKLRWDYRREKLANDYLIGVLNEALPSGQANLVRVGITTQVQERVEREMKAAEQEKQVGAPGDPRG